MLSLMPGEKRLIFLERQEKMRRILVSGIILFVIGYGFSLIGDSKDEFRVTNPQEAGDKSCSVATPVATNKRRDRRHDATKNPRPHRSEAATADTQPLVLSLRDVVELALKNNLDIAVERYNPRISEMDIVKALAEFDPELAAGIRGGRTASPGFSTWEGETALATRRDKTFYFEAGLTKKYLIGATASILLNNRRYKTNRSGVFLNPSWSSDLTFALTQPLLRDCGREVNEAEIIIARNNEAISLCEFHSKVLEVLRQAEEVYWNLVYAYEDLKVKEHSLSLAKDLLEKNKKRVEAGVLAPIETLRPQAELAAREEGIIIAQSRIRDLADELRKIINLNPIPLTEEIPVRPEDEAVYEEAKVNLASSLKEAFQSRPDYAQAKKDLENQDISLVVAKNATLPQLDLGATYNMNGLGGNLGNDVDMLASADYFDWELGLTFVIPLGNRKAKSEYLQAKWEKEKAILGLNNLENDIITEVKVAVREVETNLRRIHTNRQARELAEERLKAEEKRFELGLGGSLDVLEAQKDVTSAKSAELRAIIDYNISLVRLAKTKGTLLAKSGVAIQE